jgi:hypothetical protein
MFEYSGSIHIHSVYSDGTAHIEEIAKYANETGLDFIILTDHNTLQAKIDGFEKWYNNTLIIVGCEINDINNQNHYLTVGLENLVGSYSKLQNGELGNNLTAAEYIKQVKLNGGAGFIAHPFEIRHSIPEHPAYPWTEWDSEDFDGIEIWNHMSEWVEGLTDKNKYQRFIHPLKSIVAPDIKSVKKWDELNLKRKVVAIGSIDAHAHRHKIMGYEILIFPYKILFKSIRTHIFVENEIISGDNDNFKNSVKEIITALKNGHSFIVNHYYGNGKGFRYYAEYCDNIYNMGDEFVLDDNKCKHLTLKVLVPKESKIRLIRNGEYIDEYYGMNPNWNIQETGNYRVESWIGEKAWIFSNNIRIMDKI